MMATLPFPQAAPEAKAPKKASDKGKGNKGKGDKKGQKARAKIRKKGGGGAAAFVRRNFGDRAFFDAGGMGGGMGEW